LFLHLDAVSFPSPLVAAVSSSPLSAGFDFHHQPFLYFAGHGFLLPDFAILLPNVAMGLWIMDGAYSRSYILLYRYIYFFLTDR